MICPHCKKSCSRDGRKFTPYALKQHIRDAHGKSEQTGINLVETASSADLMAFADSLFTQRAGFRGIPRLRRR